MQENADSRIISVNVLLWSHVASNVGIVIPLQALVAAVKKWRKNAKSGQSNDVSFSIRKQWKIDILSHRWEYLWENVVK